MMTSKNNVLSFIENKTNDYLERIALGIKTKTEWNEYTYKKLGLMSRKIASYLIDDLCLKKGETCAILSESKPEYGACFFAAILTGLTIVPLDIKLTKFELNSILSDCLPSIIFTSIEQSEKAYLLQKEIPSIKKVIIIDKTEENNPESIYSFPDKYENKWRHRPKNSTALIIYTSGTTGSPKGVEITFKNIFAQLDALKQPIEEILPKKRTNILSILPMNHLFELTVGFATFLNYGFSIYYPQSLKPKDLIDTMQKKKIEFMIVVPAVLKLLKSSIEAEIKNKPPLTQKIFKFSYSIAKYIPFYCIKRLMFKKIHDKFGGNFVGCISGGSPLNVEIGKFFETIGIKIYQGYGLSETSPVVSVNTDRRSDIASVGKVLKGYTTKIDPNNGELLLKGPSVMKGYHNQPELTAEIIDENGWLHTGDIAQIKNNGHIYITGRIKNMIVLAGGKKVFPEEIEAILEKSDKFSEVCVLGTSKTFGAKDGNEEVCAVIVPTEDIIKTYTEKEIDALVREEIKTLSQQLTQYKRPTNIIISKTPLPRTTTRKVKRNEVKETVLTQ